MSGSEKSALALRPSGEVACAGCGRHFACGVAAGEQRCWCADLPRLMPLPDDPAGCYCPDCLRILLATRR